MTATIPQPNSSPSAADEADVLVENLAALWSVEPALAAMLDAVPDDLKISLIPARSGSPTAAVDNGAGQTIHLHSRYDPQDEAAKLVARHPADENCHVLFVLGFGLGYHVKAFSERSSEATLWVFEPNVAVVLAALSVCDFSKAILDRRVRIVTRLDKGQLFAEWMPQLAAISVGQRVIEHPISVQLHADFFATIRGLIEEFLAFGKTTVTTLLVNSRRTCENLARNIPWYVSSPHIGRLKNAMAGKPAIVVSAGPSLRKNKHLLKAASENAVIVSVQTTFQQLIDLGVEPDFVTSLDYHDISTQFFRNIPPGVRTELVAEPKASPEVFKLHPGPLSLLGNDFIEKLLAEMSLNHPQLTAGATVAHLAFYLAEHLGCNPIIFVGQDLGFADGLAYAPGTAYDDLWRTQTGRFETVEMLQWQRIVRDRAILRRVPDYQGKPTYTEERLYTYLQQFERDFLKSDRTIIDASEGGVAKRGARSMKLCDALEEFCRQPIERKVIAASAPSAARLEEAAECLGKRCEEAERVQQVSRDTLPLLAAMRDNLSDQSQVNQLIGQIDTLRTAMNGLGRVYQLITQLSQRSELDRYAADRRISASGLSGMERQRRQIERDMSNVEHLIAAADDFQSVVSAARQLCLARAAEAEAA